MVDWQLICALVIVALAFGQLIRLLLFRKTPGCHSCPAQKQPAQPGASTLVELQDLTKPRY